MTREETIKILAVLKGQYPHYYKDLTKDQAEGIIKLWNELLADVNYSEVGYAVKYFISNDTKGFPPVIGNIREIINKTLKPQNDITETEAWNMVYKALCNSSYNSIEEFNKLPKVVQRAVGSPDMLKAWALMDNDEINSVVQSNVMRSFRSAKQQKKEFEALPQSVKDYSKQLSEKFDIKMLK